MKSFFVPLMVALLVLASCTAEKPAPPKAADPVVENVSYIDNGLGLDRRTFYHLPEGSEIFPAFLVKAAVHKPTGQKFIDILDNYGFIKDPNPTSAQNIRSLGYVGLTVSEKAGLDMVGVNCAACHVGQIEANGKSIRIDGAPNMFAINQFFVDLGEAMKTPNLEELAKEALKEALSKGFPKEVATPTEIKNYVAELVSLGALSNGTVPHAGRADAFGAARALFFGDTVPLTAPASFPYLWGFQTTAWYHYIGNTDSALERNIGQSLGLGAYIDHKTCATSIKFDELDQMEKLAYKVQPPTWPEDLMGAIDKTKAAAGKSLYMEKCASCHDGYSDIDNGGPRHDYLKFSLNEMKTDPSEAINTARNVTVNKNVCLPDQPVQNVEMGFAAAHQLFVGRVRDTYFKAHPESASQQAAWGDHRVNPSWVDPLKPPLCTGNQNACKVYVAKPLAGIWATAPYLHNGSVPTIAELLKPAKDRVKTFAIGHRAYDTANLGYTIAAGKNSTTFQVEDNGKPIEGNSNSGHEYGTDLSPEQKGQLIEFLKSMKPSDPEAIRTEFKARRQGN